MLVTARHAPSTADDLGEIDQLLQGMIERLEQAVVRLGIALALLFLIVIGNAGKHVVDRVALVAGRQPCLCRCSSIVFSPLRRSRRI